MALADAFNWVYIARKKPFMCSRLCIGRRISIELEKQRKAGGDMSWLKMSRRDWSIDPAGLLHATYGDKRFLATAITV